MRSMIKLLCAVVLLVTVGCDERYVGPGSGTRDERVQQREEKKAASTDPVDQRMTSPQEQKAIDSSGLPVAK